MPLVAGLLPLVVYRVTAPVPEAVSAIWTGLVYQPVEQVAPLHAMLVVGIGGGGGGGGGVGLPMAWATVRTTVPSALRGPSQSRNAVKVAVVTELEFVHSSSQIPWKTNVTQPHPWVSASVTLVLRSARVVPVVVPSAVRSR